MTENEQQQQCKPQIIHLWMKMDAQGDLAKTLNWLIFPTTSISRGVVFALSTNDVQRAIEKAESIIPGLSWTGEETEGAIVTSADCTGVIPRVPLTFDRYPAKIICVEYPTKPTAREVLAFYRGRMSKELRSFRGDFLRGELHA